MTNQNIERDKIKFTNLYKSFFSDLMQTEIEITNDQVSIFEKSVSIRVGNWRSIEAIS